MVSWSKPRPLIDNLGRVVRNYPCGKFDPALYTNLLTYFALDLSIGIKKIVRISPEKMGDIYMYLVVMIMILSILCA